MKINFDKYSMILTRCLPFIYFIFGVALISSITLIEVFKTLLIVAYIPLIIKHRTIFRRNIILCLLLVYSFLFVLSTVFSIKPEVNFFSYGLFINILMFPVGVVAIQYHREELRFLVYGLCAGSLIQFLIILYQTTVGVVRPSGTINTPSQFSSVGVVALFLFIAIPSFTKGVKVHRWVPYLASLIFTLIMFVNIVLSKTRGAIIGSVIGLFLFCIIYLFLFNKKFGIILLSCFMTLLLIIYGFITICLPSVLDKINSIFVYGDTNDGHCRFAIYEKSFNSIGESPLIGHGPFTFLLSSYDGCNSAHHSHNNYLETAYASGIPSLLVLFLVDLFSIILLIRIIFNREINRNYRFFSLCLFSAYVGYLIYGMTDLILFNATLTPLFFWGVGFISNIDKFLFNFSDL